MRPFAAKMVGTCAVCKRVIRKGDMIVKLEKPRREFTEAKTAYGAGIYIDRQYAHVKCAKEKNGGEN